MSDEFDINNIDLISEITKPIASEIEAFKTSVSDFKEKLDTSLAGSFKKLNDDEDEDDIDSSSEDRLSEYLNSNKIFIGDMSDGAKLSDNVIKYNTFLTRKKAQEFRLVLNYGNLTQSVAQFVAVYGFENFLFNSVDRIISVIQKAHNAEFGQEEVIEHSELTPDDQAVVYDEDSEQSEFEEDFEELPPEADVDLTGLKPSDPEQVRLERELQEKYDAEKSQELADKSLGIKKRQRKVAAKQGEPKEFQNYPGPSKKEPLSPAAQIAFNLNYENNYYTPKGTYLIEDYKKIIDEVGAANLEYSMLTSKFSSRPVFAGFANLNITIPYNIVEANGISTLEANTAGNKEFEKEFLKRIKGLLKQYDDELNRASSSELDQDILNNIEKKRYGIVNAIDDLVGFLIARDLFTYAKLDDLEAAGVQIASKSDLLNQIIYSKVMAKSDVEARRKLDELTKKVIYYKSLSMEAFKVSASKMGNGFDLKKNEEKLDALFNVYSQYLDKYLLDKINEFFNIEQRVSDGFCFYISKNINLETLKTLALSNLSKAKSSSWTYVQCPTCNKNIYYSEESERNKYDGARFGSKYEKDKFSDYDEEIFSLVNSDGDMLTTEYLASAGPYQFEGKDYSWSDIVKLLKSGNSADHKLGIQLKKIAMIDAKAARLTKSAPAVSFVKTKCPFSNKDYPSELLEALDANRGAKSRGGAPVVSPVDINAFECGMTIDLTQMIKENKIIDPIELNIVPKTKENDPSVILGTLINAGALTPEEASAYIEEAKLKAVGGWKNSKHVFSCPCKISKAEYVKEGGLKYKYIAMPITGVYTSEFARLNLAHPPTNPDGSLAEIEENTPAYLICGRPVSLSAFERNSSEVGSLYEIMTRYAASDEFEKAEELINILIRYGVDMLDILPFIDKFFETLDKTAKLSRRSLITINGMIKAASNKRLNVQVPGTKRLTEEVLADLKLVCANGHKFFVKDSIGFGIRHKGFELKADEYVKKLSPDSLKLLNSAVLADLENPTAMFEKLLAANLINPRLSFFEDVTNQPQRLISLQDISNWNGVPGNLSKCYFVGPNGRKYVFGESLLSGVLWGLGKEGQLVMSDIGAFSRRDSATTRTRIEVSEGVSETIESDARYLTQQALTEYKDSVADERELSNNRLNPALIEQEYAKVIGSIQTMLLLIKDYSALAVSLDISPNLYNNPIFIGFDPDDLVKLKDYSKVILKGLLGYFNKLNAQVSDNFDAILQNAFDIFNTEYISTIEKLDLKSSIALGAENSMFASKRLIAAAIDSIVLALEDASISTDLITNKLKNKTTYVSQPGQDYMNFLMNEIKSVDSGDSIYISISDAVSAIINLYANIIQKDMKLTGRKAPENPISGVLNETELYYLLDNPDLAKKTSTLRTGEYLTRLMYMSAALFMADSLSLLYKKYFDKNTKLPTFIFTLGDITKYVDLSSRDLIIKLNGADPLFALSQDSINILSSILSPRKAVITKLSDSRGLTKLNNLRSAASDIEAEISKMYYATVNEKYMSEAVTIMKAYLGNLVKTLPGLSEKSNQKILINNKQTRRNVGKRDIANSLIEKCLAGSPLIDMDISENSKFVKSIVPTFDPSSESYTIANNRFMLLGTFAAITYPFKKVPSGLPFPIYIIKSQDNIFDTFGININNIVLKMNECLVLCKEDVVIDKSRPVEATIPALIRENGWVLKIAPSKLETDRIAKKTDGISPILHPLTRGVLSSGKELPITSIEEIVAIRNSYLNIDTTKGYFIGQIAPKVYADAIYPPTTCYFGLGEQESGTQESAHIPNLTSFGIILPILSEKTTNSSGAEKPVIYAKDISAVLQSTETKDLMNINVSDFLERHPVALSIDILERIERQNMERKLLLKKTLNDSEKKRINEQYYQYTKALYSTYLNMPLNVVSVNSGTKINQNSISVGNGYYVPLLRYTTINRILTSDAFSPEMGGHALWTPGNIDQKSMVISSIRSALVKMFNLDSLAEAFNDILTDDIKKATEGKYVNPGLTGEDLLSPFADSIISDGGFANKVHAAIKASNPANSDKSILRQVLSTSVDYNIDHTYNYFKSTFDANGMSMDDFSGDTSEILSMIHNTASYRQHSRYSLLYRCYNRRVDNKLPLVEKWFFTHGIPTYLAMKPNSGFKANMNLFPTTEGLSEKASKISRIRNLDDNTLPDYKDFETAPYLSMQERSKMLSIRDGEDPQAAALRIYLAGLSAEGYTTSIMSWAAELRSQLTELIKSNGRVNVKRIKKTSSKIPYRNLSIRRPLSIIDQPSADIEAPRFELIRSAAAAQSLFFRILHKVNK